MKTWTIDEMFRIARPCRCYTKDDVRELLGETFTVLDILLCSDIEDDDSAFHAEKMIYNFFYDYCYDDNFEGDEIEKEVLGLLDGIESDTFKNLLLWRELIYGAIVNGDLKG